MRRSITLVCKHVLPYLAIIGVDFSTDMAGQWHLHFPKFAEIRGSRIYPSAGDSTFTRGTLAIGCMEVAYHDLSSN